MPPKPKNVPRGTIPSTPPPTPHPPKNTTAEIEIIARAIIPHPSGYLLVCQALKPDGSPNYAYLPGGHVEFGETAAAAVSRELMEETGRRVRVGGLLMVGEHRFRSRKRVHHEINLVFRAILMGRGRERGRGLLGVESREEGIGFAWLGRDEFARADVRPGDMKSWVLENWDEVVLGEAGGVDLGLRSAGW